MMKSFEQRIVVNMFRGRQSAFVHLLLLLLLRLQLFTAIVMMDNGVNGQQQSSSVNPIISTRNGDIRGFLHQDDDIAAVFLGVPFAAPPVANLRFQRPQPVVPWANVLWTVNYKPACAQKVKDDPSDYSEDCLYLNVFAPAGAVLNKTTEDLPVMVYIHGGGYSEGASTDLNINGIVDNLVINGVIVVTIQYRLGLFGFFNGKSGSMPANNGMFDQLAALMWVQSEIGRFGGNPKRVTIFGHSAGSFSVSLHTLSPLSKGLFSQAIMMSGSAFSPVAVLGNNNRKRYASKKLSTIFQVYGKLALASGCITAEDWEAGNNQGLMSCMQLMPWTELQEMADTYVPTRDCCPWAPSVDGDRGFLPDWPLELAPTRTPNMPVMLGTVKDEMLFFYMALFKSGNLPLGYFNSLTFDNDITKMTNSEICGKNTEVIKRLVKYIYTNSNSVGTFQFYEWYQAVMKMLNDRVFVAPAAKDAEELSRTSGRNLFVYSFDYVSDSIPWPSSWGYTINGTYHSEELRFIAPSNRSVMQTQLGPWPVSQQDEEMINLMGTIWTNFAKTGNPNQPIPLVDGATWDTTDMNPPMEYMTIDNPLYMNYDKGFGAVGDNLWNNIVPSILGTQSIDPPFAQQQGGECKINIVNNGLFILKTMSGSEEGSSVKYVYMKSSDSIAANGFRNSFPDGHCFTQSRLAQPSDNG